MKAFYPGVKQCTCDWPGMSSSQARWCGGDNGAMEPAADPLLRGDDGLSGGEELPVSLPGSNQEGKWAPPQPESAEDLPWVGSDGSLPSYLRAAW